MSNAAPHDDSTVPGSSTAVVQDARPRRTAMLTVLFWNLMPTILLGAAVAGMMGRPENPSGWEGLVLFIYLIFGGGWLVLSTCLGVALAAVVVRRRMWSPILIGSLSALGGWLLGFLAILLLLGLTRVATAG